MNKHYRNSLLEKRLTPYTLVSPSVLIVIGIIGYGVIRGLIMTFYQIDLRYAERPFVGIANYVELLGQSRFRESVARTFLFVLSSCAIGTLIALAYALCLYNVKRMRRITRALSLLPYLISAVAAANMWFFLFASRIGYITNILDVFGIQISWLGNPSRAFFVVLLANAWFITPFSTLLLLAGMESISINIFDSAAIDGAGGFARLRYIILPLIKPMMGTSLIWLSFASFNMFDLVLTLTGGGPSRGTEVMSIYLYRLSFEYMNLSAGAVVMIMLIIFNLLISGAVFKLFKV